MASVKELERGKRNNEWRFAYTAFLGRDPVTGKQKTMTKNEKFPATWSRRTARKKAEENAAQFEADCKAGRILSKKEQQTAAKEKALEEMQAPTVKEYADKLMTRYKTTHSLNTVESYILQLSRFKDAYGDYKLKDITPLIMEDFIKSESVNRMSQTSGERIKYTTLKTEYAVLNAFFNAAVDDKIISLSPMVNVKCPRKPKSSVVKEPKKYTVAEIQNILKCLENEPPLYKTLVTVMIDTGCRVGEMVCLKWDAVHWDTGKIDILQNGQYVRGMGMQLTTPKSGYSRTIQLSTTALDVLKRWKLEQVRQRLAQGKPQSEYCFHGRNSEMITTSTVEKFFKRFGEKNSIDQFHPHALRHTMATLMIAQGADIVSVSRKLGHADISTTLKIYSHADEKAMSKANELYASAIYKQA